MIEVSVNTHPYTTIIVKKLDWKLLYSLSLKILNTIELKRSHDNLLFLLCYGNTKI